jgi:L-alanine-DL-glutamate epimerase-like enolase superfamily enzyme
LSISGALFIGRELEELGFYWLEEPMDEHSLPAYAWLANELSTPRTSAAAAGDVCGITLLMKSHSYGTTPAPHCRQALARSRSA